MNGRDGDRAPSSDIALGEFAGWPPLENCPDCNYNLTGLLPGRACPECGWGDGHLGVMLPAWSSEHAVDRGWRSILTWSLTIGGFLYIFTCGFADTAFLVPAILATVLLPTLVARLLVPRSREYDSRVIPFVNGVMICRDREKPAYRRWRDLAGASLHLNRRRFHDLVLVRRRDAPQPQLGERIVLEGSTEAATLVAKALHDRIRRATMEREKETTDEHG